MRRNRSALLGHPGIGAPSLILPIPKLSFLNERITFRMIADTRQDILYTALVGVRPVKTTGIDLMTDFNIELESYEIPFTPNISNRQIIF